MKSKHLRNGKKCKNLTQKKIYVFFWNFTRKGIEKLCSIDLSSIPKTQKNELTICP